MIYFIVDIVFCIQYMFCFCERSLLAFISSGGFFDRSVPESSCLFCRKECLLENYQEEQDLEVGRIKQYWIITDTS